MNAVQIAEALAMSERTVRAVIGRLGLSKLAPLEAPEPANRYERPMPGELIHIDVKKLGRIGRPGHRVNGDRARRSRGIGWEFVHVCVDDCTRLAYVEVLDDERKETVTGFLQRAVAWFADHGVTVERVMTDNGPGYRSKLHRKACQALGIRHLFTRPYRPRTNGKAERFIHTLLDGWAYARLRHQRRTPQAGCRAFLTYPNPSARVASVVSAPVSRTSPSCIGRWRTSSGRPLNSRISSIASASADPRAAADVEHLAAHARGAAAARVAATTSAT